MKKKGGFEHHCKKQLIAVKKAKNASTKSKATKRWQNCLLKHKIAAGGKKPLVKSKK